MEPYSGVVIRWAYCLFISRQCSFNHRPKQPGRREKNKAFSQDGKRGVVGGGVGLRDAFSNVCENKKIFARRLRLRSLSNTCNKAPNPTYPAVCRGFNTVFQTAEDNLSRLSDKFQQIGRRFRCKYTRSVLIFEGLTFFCRPPTPCLDVFRAEAPRLWQRRNSYVSYIIINLLCQCGNTSRKNTP